MVDIQEAIHFLRENGLFGGIVVFVFGLYRRWWVLYTELDYLNAMIEKERKDKRFWRELYFTQSDQTGRAIGAAERINS